MRVLVVGGGGREHAIVWRLGQSPRVERLLVAPGNPGISEPASCVPVDPEDVGGIVELVEREDVHLTVVGPEGPLVAGLADVLAERGRAVFGPTRAAAMIEGSKAWAKELMLRHGVPTAEAGTFTEVEPALAFVRELGGRAVVKADGLAAGKGVVVADDHVAAAAAIRASLVEGAFGDAGSTVVVEEVLEGPEVSAFALVDGETVVPLALSQDFKRAGDGDTGPNTGGMGAYSPVPWVDAFVERRIWDEIVRPAAAAMKAEGAPYRGVLFAGLMLTADGPKALEFNCRFGDPETQALMPRLRTDLLDLVEAGARGELAGVKVDWTEEAAVAVVLASRGYPGLYQTGLPITGLADAAGVDGATVFHAGTAETGDSVVTGGGRVLAVSALGANIADARARAYEAVSKISFEGMRYRRDIAARVTGEGAP
jgi:phosphoribosylamine---glycine ligase